MWPLKQRLATSLIEVKSWVIIISNVELAVVRSEWRNTKTNAEFINAKLRLRMKPKLLSVYLLSPQNKTAKKHTTISNKCMDIQISGKEKKNSIKLPIVLLMHSELKCVYARQVAAATESQCYAHCQCKLMLAHTNSPQHQSRSQTSRWTAWGCQCLAQWGQGPATREDYKHTHTQSL